MQICHICSKQFKNYRSLVKHLNQTHNIKSKEYYDEFLLKKNENICSNKQCNNNNNFLSIRDGYSKTCSHKCAAIIHRNTLKTNDSKFKIFQEKVSNNQKEIWKERKENNTDKLIIDKAKNTNRIIINNLSIEERKNRFGWMNKLTTEEKNIKSNNILEKSLIPFWNNITDIERQIIYNKIKKTKIKKGLILDYSIINRSDFNNYSLLVRKLTEINYKNYKEIINPLGLHRGCHTYHLDHKISIYDGFLYNIDPYIISSIENLEMLYYTDNLSKNKKSSISIDTLINYHTGGIYV